MHIQLFSVFISIWTVKYIRVSAVDFDPVLCF